MSLELFSFILLVGSLSLIFVVSPWLVVTKSLVSSSAQKFFKGYQAHVQNRELVMENLKDLELDFRTDKIADHDYHSMRDRFLMQAIELNEDVKKMESSEAFFRWIAEKGAKN